MMTTRRLELSVTRLKKRYSLLHPSISPIGFIKNETSLKTLTDVKQFFTRSLFRWVTNEEIRPIKDESFVIHSNAYEELINPLKEITVTK